MGPTCPEEDRMQSHRNARLGFAGRLCLVQRVLVDHWTAPQAAAAFGVSERTVRKGSPATAPTAPPACRIGVPAPPLAPSTRSALERRIRALRHAAAPQIADALHLPLSTAGDARRLGSVAAAAVLCPRWST
jgi:hypothetical protein